MRTIIALTAAAGLLITLSACATAAPSGDCTTGTSSGDASSVITAPGTFGADPKAEFPTPLITRDLQVSDVTKGDGAVVYPGQYVAAQVTLYEAKTGKYLTSTSYKESEGFIIRTGESLSKVGKALECQTVGSRVAVAANGSDLVGFAGLTADSFHPDDTVVAIFDLQSSIIGKAYGVDQIPQQGMPAVVTAPDGQPGVTVPGEDPPTGLRFAVLKQGDGAVLAKDQQIYAHYLRLDWDDPKSTTSTKSTWADFGTPEILTLSALDPSTGVGLTPGLLQALVGQKAGSQIVVVVPPSLGFPDGAAPDGVEGTSTLVYVIDILGVVA